MFCTNCEKSTIRKTINGVEFICSCGTKIEGSPYDVLIKSDNFGNQQLMTDINQQLGRNAPYDRTNTIIPQPCNNCGRPYSTQVKIGETGIVIKSCRCKNEVKKANKLKTSQFKDSSDTTL